METGPVRDALGAADRAILACGIAMLEDDATTLHTTFDEAGFTCAALVSEAAGEPTVVSIMGPPAELD